MISGEPPVEMITWTRQKLKRFKKALKKASKESVFEFEGHQFVVGYGEYLVEYLEDKLK